jgi:hypothetical protein
MPTLCCQGEGYLVVGVLGKPSADTAESKNLGMP